MPRSVISAPQTSSAARDGSPANRARSASVVGRLASAMPVTWASGPYATTPPSVSAAATAIFSAGSGSAAVTAAPAKTRQAVTTAHG